MVQSRILLVEDEPLIRQLLLEVLLEEQYDVLAASDGQVALQLLGAAGPIDLLLTDVQMPGGCDGVAVAHAARARYPLLPVVFATGRPDTIGRFGALGPREIVLTKPFSPRQLLAAIRNLLGAAPSASPDQ